jgi:acetyltransferase-like isoleucine patch superfamily enzyme
VVTDTPVVEQENVKSVGVLKKGSMFGANVTIMPGVNIGENSEIGACSQVRHDVPPNEIWYGNPAKFFKARTPRAKR